MTTDPSSVVYEQMVLLVVALSTRGISSRAIVGIGVALIVQATTVRSGKTGNHYSERMGNRGARKRTLED